MLSEGLDIFKVVLLNLEKSRGAYGVSLGQLALQVKTNRNVQIAIRTQKIEFTSPTTGEKVEYEAKKPEYFEDVLKKLENGEF